MREVTHTIRDELGLHARPAGMLVKTVAPFSCAIEIDADGKKADARRLMAVMRLAAKKGTRLTFSLDGEDEAAAEQALQTFLWENL